MSSADTARRRAAALRAAAAASERAPPPPRARTRPLLPLVGTVLALQAALAACGYVLYLNRALFFAPSCAGDVALQREAELRYRELATRDVLVAAQAGDAGAQSVLGARYLHGKENTRQDLAQAAIWFRKAAVQGMAEAQVSLASLYMQGQGLSRDDAEGVRWLRLSAAQGLPVAEFGLGQCYEFGRGVEPDYVEAQRYYERGAAQDDARSKEALSKFKLMGPEQLQQQQDRYAQGRLARKAPSEKAADVDELKRSAPGEETAPAGQTTLREEES